MGCAKSLSLSDARWSPTLSKYTACSIPMAIKNEGTRSMSAKNVAIPPMSLKYISYIWRTNIPTVLHYSNFTTKDISSSITQRFQLFCSKAEHDHRETVVHLLLSVVNFAFVVLFWFMLYLIPNICFIKHVYICLCWRPLYKIRGCFFGRRNNGRNLVCDIWWYLA